MREKTGFHIPKWPFFLGDALMLGLAGFICWQGKLPMDRSDTAAICVCTGLGALLGVLPFVLEYRAVLRLIQMSTLGDVSEKISNLERVAGQISGATNQWETAQQQAERTAAAATEIADRMAAEVRDFTAFMQKMNDGEKGALRLETEKLRRSEAEWLQIVVRILDHVFALHTAASRSGQAGLIEQLTHFQNACRDVARRAGLVPFVANAAEPFDPQRHQPADGETAPAGATVLETLATGFTFQGKLVRPALVRVLEPGAAQAKPVEVAAATSAGQSQLPLASA